MFKVFGRAFLVSLVVFPCFSFAHNYKKAEDFKTLENFKSVEEFEANLQKYTQECLDNTGGGTGGIPCFIGSELWDRELNIYYKRLMALLNENEKKLLLESQVAWLKERDKTIDFNSSLLNAKYTNIGTMYELMRAGNVDRTMTPIIRQRALFLKEWADSVARDRAKK